MKIERRAPEVENEAFEMVIGGHKMAEVAKFMGFGTTQSLMRYIARFPEFAELYRGGKMALCLQYEEDIEYLADNIGNPDRAKVKMEALTRLLKWRDPKRYGDRQQIDMNVSVDINSSLSRAERRVFELAGANALLIEAG